MIAIGIDTGGTCTDSVIYDTRTHEVLSSGKTLTTKNDLKEGIITALRSLDPELVKKAEHISLSTTLATNACVEGKGGRAKLVFIGLKPAYVQKMQGTYGLPPVSEIYFMKGDAAQAASEENKPDWEKFREDVRTSFKQYDSVAVVQMNPRYNDGEYEKQAAAIVKEELGVPCIMGYDLFQEINVQKRGATALLNARLIPVMEEFFKSIDASMEDMNIDLPIWVVKSDGNIMSREYAVSRPVETLLCGPAASIIGAMELSHIENALIVDMGGTTSDVAFVKDGIPVTSESGIRIGEWNTMVKGVSIDTFALGGDSAVEIKHNDTKIFLDKRRIVPICVLASNYPRVQKKLQELISNHLVFSFPAHEFFLLLNVPSNLDKYTEKERMFIDALRDGPLRYDEAAEAIGVSPYVLSMGRLENEGVVIRSGITPTDVMHVYGQYNAYNTKASELALQYVYSVTRTPVKELCKQIYDMEKERLYSNLVKIYMKHESGQQLTEEEEAGLAKLTQSMYYKTRENGFRYLDMKFTSKTGLVGIGAPTKIFIDDVAELLGTKADVPEYAHIANAIGAAVGSVLTEHVVRIQPCSASSGAGNFLVTGGEKVVTFEYYGDALDEAKKIAHDRAYSKALEQGASEDVVVDVSIDEDYYDMAGESARLFVETKVTGVARDIRDRN